MGIGSSAALGPGTMLMVCVPIGIAVWWLVRKEERVTTVLAGVAVFQLYKKDSLNSDEGR